ncbi:MAG: tetratricopeptide repeat protein [Candidatus Gracilibacteria bacterium]|nr:tetratricopeptide repeat protein [Candidatus Gracilibacteria bacterium]
MKKTITILWGIIIIGSIFIAINIFSPDRIDLKDKINTVIKTTQENKIPADSSSEKPTQTYEKHLELGDKYFSIKNYKLAIENYRYALQRNPENITPYIKLGETYIKNNEPTKAYDYFLKALKINSESSAAQIGVIQAFLNTRQFEKARDYLVTLDQDKIETKYYNAIILTLFKDFAKAEKLFKEIIATKEYKNALLTEYSQKFLDKYKNFASYKEGDPLFLETLISKALTETEQYEASIPLIYDVINQKPNYRDPWIILGYAYLKTGKIGDAIDAFSNAQTRYPDKPETLFFLGISYFANNNLERAAYYLEEADKKGYAQKNILNMKLADIYMHQKKYEESAAKYDEILKTNSGNTDIFNRLIWIHIEKLNNPEKALDLAQKAVKDFPDEAMSYNLLGWAYIATNDFEKAKENLQKALEMDENLDAIYINIGILYEKLEMPEKAKEFYYKALLLGQGSSVGNLAKIKIQNLTNQSSTNNN